MKELSIEEKANAYDNVRNKIAARFGTNVAQEIFSEYEESEDERIRNTIIRCLKGNMPDNDYRKECITWLEKQGEKESKKVSIWKHWKDGIAGGNEGEQIFLIKNGLHYSISSCLGYECDYIELSELDKLLSQEKQGSEPNWCHHKVDLSDCSEEYRKAYYDGWNNCNMQHEQCNAEHKLEPKFKVGDWITSDEGYINEDYRLCKIVGISDGCYTIQTINGYKGYNTFKMWENEYRLWSIEDAREGDVLASELCGTIMLYKGIEDNNIQFYCDYDFSDIDVSGDRFAINNGQHYGSVDDSDDWHPATKEQRDLLFQKMKEAGYTFDFESKELKKIEPLTDFEKAFQGMCCEKNKQFVKECCKTLIKLARKQLQSERNELELDETSYKVGVSRVLENPESYGLTKNHLKPSSSDIEALEDIMNGNSNPTSYLVLQSIIEQLKALK